MQSHILSIILFVPLVGALLILFVPGEKKNAIRWIANLFRAGRLSHFTASGAHVLASAYGAGLQVHGGHAK